MLVRIFDIGGRQVRVLNSGDRLQWDGRNDNGVPVASGGYFYLIETPKGKAKGKLILIR